MDNANRSGSVPARGSNRIASILSHIPRYSFRGVSRLAIDCSLSKSTISHLIHGKSNPLYITVERIVKSLEAELSKPLKQSDVFSENGIYPTRYVCDLAGCPGCLPDEVYESNGTRRKEYLHISPGRWTGDVHEFEENITTKKGVWR